MRCTDWKNAEWESPCKKHKNRRVVLVFFSPWSIIRMNQAIKGVKWESAQDGKIGTVYRVTGGCPMGVCAKPSVVSSRCPCTT